MSYDLKSLAKRAVACPKWRWIEGMKSVPPEGWASEVNLRDPESLKKIAYLPHCLPDLSDPATIGCVLSLVREARRDLAYYPTPLSRDNGVDWAVERPSRERQTLYSSEVEALIVALETAK